MPRKRKKKDFSKRFEFDINNKEFKLIAGIILVLIALVGIGQIITILLVVLGAYLIYQGLKK